MADRVTERILKFAAAQAAQDDKVAAQGAQLDAALQQPVGDVAPIEGIEDALVIKSLGV